MSKHEKVKLELMRYGSVIIEKHNSVEEAAYSGCLDIEENTAAPYKIFDKGGVLVWENTGPFDDSNDKLRKLAADFKAKKSKESKKKEREYFYYD